MTLIEVLAALVILGTVLALLIAARGRYSHQLVVADRRVKAVAALDELVGSWLGGDRVAVPVNKSGRMTNVYPMAWRTRVVPNRPAEDLGTRVVRVEVFALDTDANPRRGRGRDAAAAEPITSLDLMVRAPRLLQADAGPDDPATTQPATAPATQEAAEDPQTFEDPRVEQGVP